MTAIGNFIKNQRNAKNISQAELAEGIMSITYLSKVERGQSNITTEKLHKILDRLNISLHEFNLYLMSMNGNNQNVFITDYSFARKNNNKFLLRKLFNQESTLYTESNNVRHYHNTIIIAQKLRQLENLPFDESESDKINFYLHSLNEWHYYDLTLFSNSLFFLPYESVLLFSRTIYKKTKKFGKNMLYQHEMYLIYINIASNFLRQNYVESAIEVILELEVKLSSTSFYYEINKIKFLKGLCLIKLNNIDEGTKLSEKAINIMYEMNDFTNVRIHQDLLDETLNKL